MDGKGDRISLTESISSQTYLKYSSKKDQKVSKPPVAPKPQELLRSVQQNIDRASPTKEKQAIVTGTPEPPSGPIYPKEPGYYFFDGSAFIFLRPNVTEATHEDSFRNVYNPGSDFVEVTGPINAIKTEEDDVSDENADDDEATSDVFVRDSTDGFISSNTTIKDDTKGFKSLNINIRLNLSDLVGRQPTSQHLVKHATKKKLDPQNKLESRESTLPALVRKQSTYSEIDATELKDGSPDKGGGKSVAPEGDVVVPDIPPAIPPRQPLATVRENTIKENTPPLNKGGSSSEDEHGYQKYSNISEEETTYSHASEIQTAEPAKSDTTEVYSCLKNDQHIRKEVETLKDKSWFYMYHDRKKAKETLLTREDNEGSYGLICENIQPNCVCHFTLLVIRQGTIHKLQIRKIMENNRPKYRLQVSDEKKYPKHSHICELIEHHMKHKIPFVDVKLST